MKGAHALKLVGDRLRPYLARVKIPPRVKRWLFDHRFDIALLAASAICFGLFAYGSIELQTMSGIGGPIGKLLEGGADRKPTGTTAYVAAAKGTEFFNMDALWVGKGGHANIELDDGTELELDEKTLLILKRPFKITRGQKLEEKVKVVKGKVKTVSKKDEKTLTSADEKPSELPKFENGLKDRVVPAKLYPPDDGLLLMRPPEKVKITFTWVDPVKGYLVAQSKESGRAQFAEIRGEKFASLELEQNTLYFWQLVDSNKKVLSGPFRFEIRVLTDQSAKDALRDGLVKGVKRPTEIYW